MSEALTNFRFRIAGCGAALPSVALTNETLAGELGVEEDWILARCGIEQRYQSNLEETTLSLAVSASRKALEFDPVPNPDLVLCSTFTPEYLLCPTAPAIAKELGLPAVGAFDINAACSGAAIGFLTSINFLATGFAKRVLLVCSDTPTKYLKQTDRNTRILMGDGAAAIVLETNDTCESHILSWLWGSDGGGNKMFHLPGGGSALPPASLQDNENELSVAMDGRSLFRFAVEQGSSAIASLIEKAKLTVGDVDWVIVHQANRRIIQALIDRSGIAGERWVSNIGGVGNTVAASIPLALAQGMEQGLFHQGHRVLVLGFGAGLTWAGFLMQW
ncbi:3-oxoacyl-ACP synthase III family protein [Bryobacter aggregatus]|uniref:3-oxoacyl-ACP synthase III family protein n=1 Tax=Bryobacter aggregatus TaxID=360054 RepID=UPI0004E0B706|nr:ketoacyl-ACP synthase III [Bryobacter aggregatus]